MEHSGSNSGKDHVIDIRKSDIASTSISHDEGDHSDSGDTHYENRPSTSTDPPAPQPSPLSPTASPRNVSFRRRGDGRPRRSPLNSGWWISIELLVNVSQIVAAIIVLSLSRHEKPHAPLFEWVIGYTAGCVATLPHLYWRYIHRNGPGFDQGQTHSHLSSIQENPSETTPYTSVSFTRTLDGGNRQRTSIISRLGQNLVIVGPRLNALVDQFKMALDCFFAAWFVVGNVWIFGGHSSPEDSPNLYRLCIAFLTFSCVGYAMPFILCATICCCLPCIISFGFREDPGHTRGATMESINALPTYKFKSKRNQNHGESESSSEGPCEGGIFAAGTNKERIVSAEDAACCICLARYSDNDSLRELPCSHFFHTECVDKWLAINALCPLCKSEVEKASGVSSFFARLSRPSNSRAGNGEDA